ncbi:hypothetical protein [Microbacterium sp.]|uniref:hypothetical protein n=1 Tax=Microbacterium sp. TaxID=51671 RepID=UPI0028AA90BE|nr:hypothetical protein [Microbacterium sp.]
MASLAFSLREVDRSEILFFTSPTLGTDMVGDQSIVRPDFDGLAALSQALRDDTVPQYVAERPGK